MKKFTTVAITLLLSMGAFMSCNKGDENPFNDWKCTCFVTTTDTVSSHIDTVVLALDNVDKANAESLCTKSQAGYVDTTLGRSATCKLK